MTEQIGIAVLGCGYWGMNYVRVFSELPGTRVHVACDRRPQRMQEVGRRFPGVILTTEIDHALSVPGVDAVVVCTEATSHYPVARRCLQAGKHVLVEKPMATRAADAEALNREAGARHLTLMVGHTFLYNAGIRKIKECIKQGEVGRVYYLYSSRTNLGPIRDDVNAVWDLAPHDVAIFNYLLESVPEWVSAVGVRALRNAREDVAFISLGYPDGVVGHVHVSWADPNKVRELVVVGSDRRIAFNDLNPLEQVRIFEKSVSPVADEAVSFGEYHFQMRDGNIISPRIEVTEPLRTQCSHFVECITDRVPSLSGGQQGQEVVQVIEAIDRSLKRHGVPVRLGPVKSRGGRQDHDQVAERNGYERRNGRHTEHRISTVC